MKKILLSACMLFCISGTYAQIKVGAKAGLNLSILTDHMYNMQAGFHAGGFAEFAINDLFAFQPELLYSTQGAKTDKMKIPGVGWHDITLSMNYLNVPLLLKVNLAKDFSVEAGPQIGFLLSAESETLGVSVDMDQYYKEVDISAALGISYTFAEKFVASARCIYGFTKVERVIAGYSNTKARNTVFSLSLGYKFYTRLY